jgi:protein SSD1
MDRDQVAKISQQCNMKKGESTSWRATISRADEVAGARLAEQQSVHLHLCMLIHDLTEKYGPVIRQGKVTSVLDTAFDIVVVS